MGIESLAIGALALTAVSTYKQLEAQKSQASAQEDAAENQRNMQARDERQNRRQTIRDERIRRARILQASENTGVAGSSSEFGSTSALATTTGSRLGALQTQGNFATGQTRTAQRAADASRQGQIWGAVGSLSNSAFGAAGGFGAFGGQASSAATGGNQSGGLYNNVFSY